MPDPDHRPAADRSDPTGPPLTAEQLARWARLVADGGEPFPDGLGPGDRRELADRVRRLRRGRLIRYVARQVALDIHRHRPDAGGSAGQQGG